MPPGSASMVRDKSAATSFGVEVSAIHLRDASEIERDVAAFAKTPGGGLVVTGSIQAVMYRNLLITVAARHKAYPPFIRKASSSPRAVCSRMGLIIVDQYRRAPHYVDRILKGEKPADLPVQAPTKYELVINLKTAKALGLDVPNPLVGRADQLLQLRWHMSAIGLKRTFAVKALDKVHLPVVWQRSSLHVCAPHPSTFAVARDTRRNLCLIPFTT